MKNKGHKARRHYFPINIYKTIFYGLVHEVKKLITINS